MRDLLPTLRDRRLHKIRTIHEYHARIIQSDIGSQLVDSFATVNNSKRRRSVFEFVQTMIVATFLPFGEFTLLEPLIRQAEINTVETFFQFILPDLIRYEKDVADGHSLTA